MGGHETEGVHAVAEPAGPLLQQEVETVPVRISEKDGLATVPAEDHVVESAGKMNTWFACHYVMVDEKR